MIGEVNGVMSRCEGKRTGRSIFVAAREVCSNRCKWIREGVRRTDMKSTEEGRTYFELETQYRWEFSDAQASRCVLIAHQTFRRRRNEARTSSI